MKDITELFCHIDDFCKEFEPEWQKHLICSRNSKRGPKCLMSTSEMLTIVILFHQSGYRTFKQFYGCVKSCYRGEFPNIVSYSRFVYLMKGLLVPLFAYMHSLRGDNTGISFIDSTSIAVCKNKRISRNRVFKGIAKRGKTTTGWFYGFKLHLIINDQGEILSFQITPGNVADIAMVETLSKGLFGKLFGDKGYISSELGKFLLERGLQFFTTLRGNMKQRLMTWTDKILLRKRSVIETINDQLKNISQIEHTRHRSIVNFVINMLAGIAAYSHQPKKPSLNLSSAVNRMS